MSLCQPRIYSCEEWGAISVATKFPTKAPVGAVVHHTAGPNAPPLAGPLEVLRASRLARAIQRDHRDRKWADSGHHFLLSRGGVILEGRHGSLKAARRGRCVRGAHAGSNEANSRYLGVEWEGRYDQQFLVPDEQWEAGVQLYAWLAFWGDFDTANIQPHSHFRATVCPGLLRDRIPLLRQQAHDLKVRLLTENL